MGNRPSLFLRLTLILCLVLGSSAVVAHASARADLPRHGGEVRAAADYHVELVVEERRLTLYARDNRARVLDLSATQAKALVWTDDGSYSVALTADSHARLIAATDVPKDSAFRVVVTLEMPGREKASLLFGPMRP